MARNTPGPNSPRGSLSNRDQIDLLLEEYRALYALATFRMSALDRRVPLAATALIAVLVGALALPADAQMIVLLALPLGAVWSVATALTHARSFEDALRRIEEIESRVNTLAGDELLVFQSRHPSRASTVGGRTGRDIIRAVAAASLLTTAACVWAAATLEQPSSVRTGLAVYASAMLIVIALLPRRLRLYRYRRDAK